jgi:hypothetical protein
LSRASTCFYKIPGINPCQHLCFKEACNTPARALAQDPLNHDKLSTARSRYTLSVATAPVSSDNSVTTQSTMPSRCVVVVTTAAERGNEVTCNRVASCGFSGTSVARYRDQHKPARTGVSTPYSERLDIPNRRYVCHYGEPAVWRISAGRSAYSAHRVVIMVNLTFRQCLAFERHIAWLIMNNQHRLNISQVPYPNTGTGQIIQ